MIRKSGDMGGVNSEQGNKSYPVAKLPSANSSPSTSPLHWFVLYTKSRCEKKVADGLVQKGLEAYCPVRKTKRKRSDRYKLVEEPLFRSYCFVRLAEKDRGQVFVLPGVVSYLFWLGRPALVRDKEIAGIREMLGSFDHEHIVLRELDVYDCIKVRGGALDSREGEILEKRGSKLQVFLEDLQLVVYVDLRLATVERM